MGMRKKEQILGSKTAGKRGAGFDAEKFKAHQSEPWAFWLLRSKKVLLHSTIRLERH